MKEVMDSQIKVRYAVSRTSDDVWPIYFRPDCERTFCDGYGDSEGLLEIIENLDKAGYDLLNELPERYRNK